MTAGFVKGFLAVAACLTGMGAAAQVRDVSFTAGVYTPLYSGTEGDAVITLAYGQFYRSGLGFRTGFQWIPSVADVDNIFGVPMAFAYRTKARGTHERIGAGFNGAADALAGSRIWSGQGAGRDAAAGFLMNLFSDMEYFVGLTPGFVAGPSSSTHEAFWGPSWQYWEKSWTEKRAAFSLSIDAGMTLNYSVRRFSLKLSPAFHYNLTNNYLYHSVTGEKDMEATRGRTQPLRWFFSLSGGLAFRF